MNQQKVTERRGAGEDGGARRARDQRFRDLGSGLALRKTRRLEIDSGLRVATTAGDGSTPSKHSWVSEGKPLNRYSGETQKPRKGSNCAVNLALSQWQTPRSDTPAPVDSRQLSWSEKVYSLRMGV